MNVQGAVPAPMPQLILASGQMVQGIQGAQLLIPTSQGIINNTVRKIIYNCTSNIIGTTKRLHLQ